MIRERTIETARGPFRCLDAGAGWPVILLHGFPLSAEMWRPQLESVPQGWRYLAPDLRGFGPSPAEGLSPPSMDVYADDVEALLDALDFENAAIGGLSMGGYITFALYRRAPERFNAMVLADTKAEADTPEGREGRRSMSELLRTSGVGPVADRMLPKLLSPASQADAAIVSRVRGLIEANGADGLDRAVLAMMERPDSTPDVPTFQIPVLVIVGEDDTVTPRADAERIVAASVRSQLVVLPGAGHLSNLETPEAFSTALSTFLTSSL